MHTTLRIPLVATDVMVDVGDFTTWGLAARDGSSAVVGISTDAS
jgi:hypothetical protein